MSTSRQHWLDSHPSLNQSMEDFEARDFSPTIPDMPSQHSGFRSAQSSEYSEATSSIHRSYSPPAWRKAGSGWFKHQQSRSPTRNSYGSKRASPNDQSADEDEDDVTGYQSARRIPLPESPIKGRSPSNSPEHETPGAVTEVNKGAARDSSTHTTVRHVSEQPDEDDEPESPTMRTPTQNNYIRFSTSLDVVQRTEPIEAVVVNVRKAIRHVTSSPYMSFLYAISTLLLYWLVINIFTTPRNGPAPDLLKVAGLAQSFEPVIYYSEHGHAQIDQLQETGVAVWDLGESVRSTNMTSAPMIVKQLDELSDSLKNLAIELTRFFASVDADIDSILLVMEYVQRELVTISNEPPSTISSAWSNAHTMLTRVGLVGDSKIVQELLGQTYQQRTKEVLERTFHDFLSTLEESINNELRHSMQLFQLFEAIDKQFLNLQRTVIREQDQQETLENDFLGSLWTKLIGVNASKLRKYEKNKELLQSVRDRTVQNKHVLVDHNQRLLTLKSNLEVLRQKLVGPIIARASNSSSLSIDAQIQGLQATYQQLKGSRDSQKRKLLELVYGAGNRRVTLPGEAGRNGHAIEGSTTSNRLS